MFCPECKSEYQEGVTRCADCDVPLVDRLSEPQSDAETTGKVNWDDLVPALASYDEGELLMAKSLLDAAGIPVYVPGGGFASIADDQLFGGANFALGPVKLMVPREHAEHAKEVLQSPPANEEEPGS